MRGKLPSVYEEDLLFAMVRDATRAYVYWEVTARRWRLYRDRYQEMWMRAPLSLLAYDWNRESSAWGEVINRVPDVGCASDWVVEGLVPGICYRFALGKELGTEAFLPVLVSNPVQLPGLRLVTRPVNVNAPGPGHDHFQSYRLYDQEDGSWGEDS